MPSCDKPDFAVFMKKNALCWLLLLLFMPVSLWASDTLRVETKPQRSAYVPQVYGLVRAKYEYNTSIDAHRFLVRNARIGLIGNIVPSYLKYRTEIDLSDEGRILLLDASLCYAPEKGALRGFSATIGQHKVPFSTENLRSPNQYYFANRSFVAKQMSHDVRTIGFKLAYELDTVFPFSISAGIYNSHNIDDQKQWQRHLNYAARLVLDPFPCWQLSFSLNAVKPGLTRMNLYDVSTFVDFYNVHLEAEYVYKQYMGNTAFAPTHAFLAFACYDIFFKDTKHADKFGYWPCKISPVIRYDFMTDNSRDGSIISDYARQRITAGVIFSPGVPFLSDIRLNYEHYFYQDPLRNRDNKLVLECVARF